MAYQSMLNNIRKQFSAMNVWNEIGKALPIVVTIKRMVRIVTSTEFVNFLVVDLLATSVIVGCDFCGRHVDAVKPRLVIVQMDD